MTLELARCMVSVSHERRGGGQLTDRSTCLQLDAVLHVVQVGVTLQSPFCQTSAKHLEIDA